jgi:hypothetical protein
MAIPRSHRYRSSGQCGAHCPGNKQHSFHWLPTSPAVAATGRRAQPGVAQITKVGCVATGHRNPPPRFRCMARAPANRASHKSMAEPLSSRAFPPGQILKICRAWVAKGSARRRTRCLCAPTTALSDRGDWTGVVLVETMSAFNSQLAVKHSAVVPGSANNRDQTVAGLYRTTPSYGWTSCEFCISSFWKSWQSRLDDQSPV